MLTHLAEFHPLDAGAVFVVLVAEPTRAQRIEHVTRLDRRDWTTVDRDDMSDLLCREVRKMPIPDRWGKAPKHALVTVVCRYGFSVLGPREGKWLMAWRYSNHLMCAYSGSLMVVTEHGWSDFMTKRGGREPRLATPLRVVDA